MSLEVRSLGTLTPQIQLMSLGDEFDEVDLAVAHDGPPDGVALDPSLQSNHRRGQAGLPQRRDTEPLPQTGLRTQRPPPPRGPASGPQSACVPFVNGCGQPIKAEASCAAPPAQRATPPPVHVAPNQLPGAHAPPSAGQHNKPSEMGPVARATHTSAPTAPENTPPLDSSSTTEHNPPVGFFTARAAESLQKGAALPSDVPIFNPHLESPSIRKTAGVDHSKSKPVRTEAIGAPTSPAAVLPPRTNFVNPQTDKTRKVGMPMGAASPLQNRGSYKPPQMKRPADGGGLS